MLSLDQALTAMIKQANGDMIQYFSDHPSKFKEKMKRDKAATYTHLDKRDLRDLVEQVQLVSSRMHEKSRGNYKRRILEHAKSAVASGEQFFRGDAVGVTHRASLDDAVAAIEQESRSAALERSASAQVAQTILDQMGGKSRLVAMTGAKNFVYNNDWVSFQFPNKGAKTRGNYLKITLNGMDTYDMVFGYIRGYNFKTIKTYNGVFAEQLSEIFSRMTGLHLRLAAASDEGARIPDGVDSGHIEGEDSPKGSMVPSGNGNNAKKAGRLLVGPRGMFPHHWPSTYAHGEADRILGPIVTFNKPLKQGRFTALLVDSRGNNQEAVVFSWNSLGSPVGLIVLKSDTTGMASAQREVRQSQGKTARRLAKSRGKMAAGDPRIREIPGFVNQMYALVTKDGRMLEADEHIDYSQPRLAESVWLGHYTWRELRDVRMFVLKKVPKHLALHFTAGKNGRWWVDGYHAWDLAKEYSVKKYELRPTRRLPPEVKRAGMPAKSRGKTAVRGKAQKALLAYVADWEQGQSAALSEISRHSSLRGVHFSKIMSAAEALKKRGLLGFDGVRVTKTAKLSDGDAQSDKGIKQTKDKTARMAEPADPRSVEAWIAFED